MASWNPQHLPTYLWVFLAEIHLLKCAFHSLSHKQKPAGSAHFQTTSKPLNNILRCYICLPIFFLSSSGSFMWCKSVWIKSWSSSLSLLGVAYSHALSAEDMYSTPPHNFVLTCVFSQAVCTQTHWLKNTHLMARTRTNRTPCRFRLASHSLTSCVSDPHLLFFFYFFFFYISL